mmetsp:Transcript_2133/g.4495  ORF Transcript_2133/g.4495 Transcript_2133/m.4495 type:complete len:139 (+) Transcript_2133:448-864(+)
MMEVFHGQVSLGGKEKKNRVWPDGEVNLDQGRQRETPVRARDAVPHFKDCKESAQRQQFVDNMHQFWFEKRKERMRARTRTAGKFRLYFTKQRAQTLALAVKSYHDSVILPWMKEKVVSKTASLWGVMEEVKRRRRVV